jgi:hydrogenase expression/formation protein HypD
MKYIDEYRDGEIAKVLVRRISSTTTQPWTIMEICGGQTHTIVRYGLQDLLPEKISLIHGPGCPVCVTPLEMVDKAIAIASREDTILASYGDMLRVPGSRGDLLQAKASGGDVRIVYSPLEAVRLASTVSPKRVVFFGVGFETTAPANAMAVHQARSLGLNNFFLLSSHVLVPPAVRAILSSPGNRVQALLAAGHVCSVMGYTQYIGIAQQFGIPVVVTGFEPVDILQGIAMAVDQLEHGKACVENQYSRVVRKEGNEPARKLMEEVFEVTDRKWRGIGVIPASGLSIRPRYAAFDAEKEFHVGTISIAESTLCIAGEVLTGRQKPVSCPAFGVQCTPLHPLGAPMVSSEGACAAYYRYEQSETPPSQVSSGKDSRQYATTC